MESFRIRRRVPLWRRVRRARRRTVAAVLVSVALAAGAATAALVLAGGGGAPAPVGTDGIAARATIARSALFADSVDATLDALVDTRRIDASSLSVAATFPPYAADAQPRVRVTRVGPLAHLIWRVRIDCLVADCLPPDPIREGRRYFVFPPAQIAFRTRAGGRGSVSVPWPSLELASRMSPFDMIYLNPFTTPPFHASTALAAPSYRISPTLLEVLAAALGALLLALALVLAFRAVARTREDLEPEIDPWLLARMTPLERAVYVLERARVRGEPRDRRKALERAALELRRHGDEELVDSARALAWSHSTPTADELGELADTVRRRNGH
jgi:hypothetical protein